MNPQRTVGVPSFFPAQVKEQACEEGYYLMEEVVERENMFYALRRVERNKGAAKIDGMEIKFLLSYLKKNWLWIKVELLEGTYKPMPVRRVEIPKSDGGVDF